MLPSKWENLSRCSIKSIRLLKTITCIGLRAEQIVNIYPYFSILGVAFAVPFLCHFQKLQLLVAKKFWTKFCCIALLYLWAQKMSQIFKILFQTGDINIFALRSVFFSRYVQLQKLLFWRKNINGEIWDTLQ